MAFFAKCLDISSVRAIILDLDDTLFDYRNILGPLILSRFAHYTAHHLEIPVEQAAELCTLYWKKYGAPVFGLAKNHGIQAAHFLKETHPLDEIKKRLPELPDAYQNVSKLPQPVYIMSNGPKDYVRCMLEHLKLMPFIDTYFGIEDMDFIPKPKAYAFRLIVQKIGRYQPSQILFIDDMLPNVQSAQKQGLQSIWFNPEATELLEWPLHSHISVISSLKKLTALVS